MRGYGVPAYPGEKEDIGYKLKLGRPSKLIRDYRKLLARRERRKEKQKLVILKRMEMKND